MLNSRKRFYTKDYISNNSSLHGSVNVLKKNQRLFFTDLNIKDNNLNSELSWNDKISNASPVSDNLGNVPNTEFKKETMYNMYGSDPLNRNVVSTSIPSLRESCDFRQRTLTNNASLVPEFLSSDEDPTGKKSPEGLSNILHVRGYKSDLCETRHPLIKASPNKKQATSNTLDVQSPVNVFSPVLFDIQREGESSRMLPKKTNQPVAFDFSTDLKEKNQPNASQILYTRDNSAVSVPNVPGESEDNYVDSFGLKCAIDFCLKQDECMLHLDSFVSNIPIGSYKSVSKVFSLTESLLSTSSEMSFHNSLNPTESNSLFLPESFKATLQWHKTNLRSAQHGSSKRILHFIPDLDIICYATPTSHSSSCTTLHFWKWASGKPPLEISFQEPITAIGHVFPIYFFLHDENSSERPSYNSTNSSSPSKLLLIATTTKLSLWSLGESTHPSSGNNLCVVETPYNCASPKATVSCISGHNESGRLFFGDIKGGIHEFVFTPVDLSKEKSWLSFLSKLSPWTSSTTSTTLTTSENVSTPSFMRRVFGGTYAIVELFIDGRRGLVYALDAGSNVQVFFLPPPEVSLTKDITEYPLQPIVVLTHATILSQMRGINREFMRANQEENEKMVAFRQANPFYYETNEASLKTNRIVCIVPTKLNEGDSVIAIAFSDNGSRLYLCARLELPLLPKKLEKTDYPSICQFQFIKGLYVANWKPPCSNLLEEQLSRLPSIPVASVEFYNQRTFICSYPQSDGSSLLMCIAFDETNVLSKRHLLIENSTPSGNVLNEWCQFFRLPDCEILGIYEQASPSLYHNLLEGEGSLPSPYDILARMYREKLEDLFSKQATRIISASKSPTPNSNSCQETLNLFSKGVIQFPSKNNLKTYQKKNNRIINNNYEAPTLYTNSQTTRCIPPSALHNWVAAQTVPSRMFTIITSRGIYQLQQNRFYDLIKNTACDWIDNGTSDQSLVTNKQFDIKKLSCYQFSVDDVNSLAPYLLQSAQNLQRHAEIKSIHANMLYAFSSCLLMNIHFVCQLMAPEQAMALAWQILTFTAGLFQHKKEPSLNEIFPPKPLKGNPSPKFSTLSNTPFSFALRASNTKMASNVFPDTISPMSSHSLTTHTEMYQFPLPLIQKTLFSWLTCAPVHSLPSFQDSFSSAFHGFDRMTSIRNNDPQSFLIPHGSGQLVSARVKGLLLYIARIVRPFWECPIFETIILKGNIHECFHSSPGIYCIQPEDDYFSLSKLGKKNYFLRINIDSYYKHVKPKLCPVTVEVSIVKNDLKTFSGKTFDGPTTRKRQRNEDDKDECDNVSVKRTRFQQIDSRIKLGESRMQEYSFSITSRFNNDEFFKTCCWLDQLQWVIQKAIPLIESFDAIALDFSGSNTNSTRYLFQKTSFEKTQLQKINPFLLISNHKNEPAIRQSPKFTTEVFLFASIKKKIQYLSQYLSFCSLLLMETKESNVLPAVNFNHLMSLSLSDFLVASDEVKSLLQTVLTRHIISPHILQERCPLLFSQEDLAFQCALHPLFTFHRVIMAQYQSNWELAYSDNALLDKTSSLRSPGILKSVEALLNAASHIKRRVSLNFSAITTILVELQLFDHLIDFISRIAEAALLDYNLQQEKSGLNFDVSLLKSDTENVISPLNVSDNFFSCYKDDPRFSLCYNESFFSINIILNKYLAVSNASDIYDKKIGILAGKFVTACFALQPSHTEGFDIKKSPRDIVRTWLHYVVLDWINEIGQRTFPISLENAQTSAYASWVNQRKGDLGPDPLKALSRFFYNNNQYCQFAEFLLNVASRTWREPVEVLGDTISIPNSIPENNESEISKNISDFCALENHGSTMFPNTNLLVQLKPIWSIFVNYLSNVSCGLSLEQRYANLVEARDTLETRLAQLEKINNDTATVYHETQTLLSSKDTIQNICATKAKVQHAIESVLLQANLCRELVEICCFLYLKYAASPSSLFCLAFSTDATVRLNSIAKIAEEHPNQYQHLHNVQSLLYLLRWKVYETPLELLQLIQEFADASKFLIPFPGLCLLSIPFFLNPAHLPLTDTTGGSTISRQSIVSAAIFCRGFIAVDLQSSALLCDFISKYICLIIESRTENYGKYFNLEKNGISSLMFSFDTQNINETKLLYLGDILLTLHEVALIFRDKASTSSLTDLPKQLPLCPNFQWTTHWWIWPSLLITQQLNSVDNHISWDNKRQLEGQQKLPFYQKLVDEYQEMMELQFNYKDSNELNLQINKTTASNFLSHLDLFNYHYFIILLDLKEAWMTQLLGMASCLPYIHLLTPSSPSPMAMPTDDCRTVVSYTNDSNDDFTSKRFSFTANNSELNTKDVPPPSVAHLSDDDMSALRNETSNNSICLSPIKDNTAKGQNQLTLHIRGLYYKSPSKLQFYFERSQDLIKGSEQVIRRQRDWYAFYQGQIEECLKEKFLVDDNENMQFCLQELALAEKGFLQALDKLQQRVPMLQAYQRTIQHVLIQK